MVIYTYIIRRNLRRVKYFLQKNTNNINMVSKFHERIRNLRIEKGLLQKDVAKVFNVARKTVSDWEIAGHEPSYSILMDIAKFYNVSIDYLLGMIDEM